MLLIAKIRVQPEIWISGDQTGSEDFLDKKSLQPITKPSILKVLVFSFGGLSAGVSQHLESVVLVALIFNICILAKKNRDQPEIWISGDQTESEDFLDKKSL